LDAPTETPVVIPNLSDEPTRSPSIKTEAPGIVETDAQIDTPAPSCPPINDGGMTNVGMMCGNGGDMNSGMIGALHDFASICIFCFVMLSINMMLEFV
jgi:hypothetical protein